jgi:hypothetical protein
MEATMAKTIITEEDEKKKKKKSWSRKRSVAKRYDCDPRTVDRMVEDKRIPRPHYFPNSTIPFWDDDELAANERRATVNRPA